MEKKQLTMEKAVDILYHILSKHSICILLEHGQWKKKQLIMEKAVDIPFVYYENKPTERKNVETLD